MKKRKLKLYFRDLILIIVVFGISISLQSILAAWVGPPSAPPTGNVDPPLNSGDLNQMKGSGLILNSNNIDPNGLEVANGDVEINGGDLEINNGGNLSIDGDLYVNDRLTGGVGARSTAGTVDWSHVSNAMSGSGYSLLRGTAVNGPGGSEYFHPFNFEYGGGKDGGGNITQLAVPYANAAAQARSIYMRGRYSGTWSAWKEIGPAGNCLVVDYTLVINSGTLVDQFCPTNYLITAVQDTNGFLQNMENAPNEGSVVCCK